MVAKKKKKIWVSLLPIIIVPVFVVAFFFVYINLVQKFDISKASEFGFCASSFDLKSLLDPKIEEYLKSQYIENEVYAGFGSKPIEVSKSEIKVINKADVFINGTCFSPCYTFYGCVIADALNVSYDRKKVQKMVEEVLWEKINYDGVQIKENYPEIVMDCYFTILLSGYLKCRIHQQQVKSLMRKIDRIVEQNIDYNSPNIATYCVQFYTEIYAMIGEKMPPQNRKMILDYLNKLVKERVCEGSPFLAEIKLTFQALDVEIPQELDSQIAEYELENYYDGGYFLQSPDDVNLHTTYRFLRISHHYSKSELMAFLSKQVYQGVVSLDGTLEGTDIRILAFYINLFIKASMAENGYT